MLSAITLMDHITAHAALDSLEMEQHAPVCHYDQYLLNYIKRSEAPCKRYGGNIVGCYMLRPFAHPVACCWMLLRVVAQSLKPVKLFSQQLPTFLLFHDRRSVAQHCWILLHSSSNIVGATHAHYAWLHRLMGCILPTMLCRSQHCWELLRPFASNVYKYLLLMLHRNQRRRK